MAVSSAPQPESAESPQLASKSSSASSVVDGGEAKGFAVEEGFEAEGLRPELTSGVVVVEGLEERDGREVVAGTLLARGSGEVTRELPLVFVEVCICPLAVVILLVKEEMAQPVQVRPSLGTGVPMRGVVPADVVAPVAGWTVSGRVAA
jgi:hypothetical protein